MGWNKDKDTICNRIKCTKRTRIKLWSCWQSCIGNAPDFRRVILRYGRYLRSYRPYPRLAKPQLGIEGKNPISEDYSSTEIDDGWMIMIICYMEKYIIQGVTPEQLPKSAAATVVFARSSQAHIPCRMLPPLRVFLVYRLRRYKFS